MRVTGVPGWNSRRSVREFGSSRALSMATVILFGSPDSRTRYAGFASVFTATRNAFAILVAVTSTTRLSGGWLGEALSFRVANTTTILPFSPRTVKSSGFFRARATRTPGFSPVCAATWMRLTNSSSTCRSAGETVLLAPGMSMRRLLPPMTKYS